MGGIDNPNKPKGNIDNVEATESLEVEELGRGRFIRERTLFGVEIEGEMIKRPPLNVVIDIGKNPKDFLERSVEVEAKSLDRFADGLSYSFGVPKAKLFSDTRFKSDFLRLRDYELNAKRRPKEKRKFRELKQRFILTVAGHIGENNELSSKYCESYLRIEKDREIGKRLSVLGVNSTDPRIHKVVADWREEMGKNDEEYKQGKLTDEHYLAKRDAINAKAVKDSDDKDLQETWQGYKKDEAESMAPSKWNNESSATNPNEKPVETVAETEKVFADLPYSEDLKLDIHENGSASATLGKEKFLVDIMVYKNYETNSYVCYLTDKYLSDGNIKIESKDLGKALDRRYIDCFMSDKIGKLYKDPDAVPNVPDTDMVTLGERLIGEGKLRDFRFSNEDRKILDSLVQILIEKDNKYSGVYSKVKVLNWFLQKKDNVDRLRKDLRDGKKPGLKDILGDMY